MKSIGIFKPAPQDHDFVGVRFGCAPAQVPIVSLDGWEAAAGHGSRAAWVNRAGAPVDRPSATPDHCLTPLPQIPELVA
ncbi:hypothetical protein [Profundibacterium mesophilum]|uniref:2-haloacid dehalogenase n=1 Tax=Profundibacterium mesophilum KAUST100406-0324 TaxID=1037889 RepID=A0A921TBU2_9RHOB|nr:hypothetical protein [Profundibacterium mesophilum]KAF0676230.1 2-haloacid dehalogenase [Profundibacterium mesophilum KAUST100406-0324]